MFLPPPTRFPTNIATTVAFVAGLLLAKPLGKLINKVRGKGGSVAEAPADEDKEPISPAG